MARLVLNCGGVDLITYKLGDITTIGRAPLNRIVIDNPAVSAQHAIIARSDESYRLKDLHSTNGTKVNDVSVTDIALHDGDKIQFGAVIAVFAGCCRECESARPPQMVRKSVKNYMSHGLSVRRASCRFAIPVACP